MNTILNIQIITTFVEQVIEPDTSYDEKKSENKTGAH